MLLDGTHTYSGSKCCWTVHTRTQEGPTSAARTKQHDGEEGTGIRTAGRGKGTKGETRQNKSKKEERRRENREHRTPAGDSNMGARLT